MECSQFSPGAILGERWDGVFLCLVGVWGVVNTVEFYKGYDLFRFDAPKGGVLGCLLEKGGVGKNLIAYGRDGGGVECCIFLKVLIDSLIPKM